MAPWSACHRPGIVLPLSVMLALVAGRLSSADAYAAKRIHKAKHVQQPHHDGNNDNNIQDILDLGVHWDVVVNEPQQDSNDNQSDDERNQGH
jgi:hypothetical protein